MPGGGLWNTGGEKGGKPHSVPEEVALPLTNSIALLSAGESVA
jgi:hypothetical protein